MCLKKSNISLTAHFTLQGVVSGSVEPHEVVISRLFEAVTDGSTTDPGLQVTSSKFAYLFNQSFIYFIYLYMDHK